MTRVLRPRNLNVQKQPDDKTLPTKKAVPSKRKTASGDEPDGPTGPKRHVPDGLIQVPNAPTQSSNKTAAVVTVSPQKQSQRLLPIIDQEKALKLEVDPAPHYDFDKQHAKDPYAISEFARDIFKYCKHQERAFQVQDYFESQRAFTRKDRATAVDWLVSVQESFELNHETLYLAVKLMDLFVFKSQPHSLTKATLQLVPCAAVFVASKVEEVQPPTIKDLLYMCKNTYTPERLKEMEREMLRVIEFQVGAPLSYSFLRRYGRVSQVTMPVLTTARYYLETSLHYIKFCATSESKMAAACMLLALRVTKKGDWTAILEKYSGYKLADVEPLMFEINHMVRRFPVEHKSLQNVREKYSDPTFFKVAKQPLLTDRLRDSVEN